MMPKSTDKKKGTKRRKTQNSSRNVTETDGSPARFTPKRMKLDPDDGIAKSKQLASKLQKRTRTTNTASATNKTSEPRICPNGKPLPSLAELERMYADSDGDDEPAVTIKTVPKRCRTPTLNTATLTDQKLVSPTILKQITSKVIDLISNLPDPITLDDDGPPPPVIPQKRPKKGDKPYIDGCKDRPQVPWNPKSVVGKSNDKYGIISCDLSDDEENMCPKKRRKSSNIGNISKSIFNPQSDEIAEMLRENESRERVQNSSPDSNKTVPYEYNENSPTRNIPRSFSPLPSTSRDSETILKNDKLFNESFQFESDFNDTINNDVCIIVDDGIPARDTRVGETLDILDDDCCIIDESDIKKKREISPVKIEDEFYGTLDLTQNFDTDVCEVIDVDDVIAENTAFIKKYRKESNIDTVTCVDTNVSYIPKRERTSDQNVTPSEHGCTDNAVILDTTHAPCVDLPQINNQPDNQSLHSSIQQANINNTQSNHQYSVQQATNNAQSNQQFSVQQPNTNNAQSNQRFSIEQANTNNTQRSQQFPETSNTNQNIASINNEIAEVVTNFFNRRDDTISASATVDLTSSQSVINKISSWMSSIESYIRGKQNTEQTQGGLTASTLDPNVHNTCRCNIMSRTTCCHNKAPIASNSMNDQVNVIYVPLQGRHQTSKRKNRYVISNVINLPPDVSSTNQVKQVTTVQQNSQAPVQPMDEAPARSLGDCPICMDSLANNAVASTLCGHVFCMGCIKAAIKANGKKCPTCRKALKGVGYHQLFL